jgi:TPR repeat protein
MNAADRVAGRRPVLPPERKQAWRVFIDLLHAGGSFRGFFEFALIGAIVLAFLHGLDLNVFSAWRALLPGGGPAAVQSGDQAGALGMGAGAIADNAGQDAREPHLPPIPRLSEVVFDPSYFATAEEPLRSQLASASLAYAAHDYLRALAILADADQRDPRVLLVRGTALVGFADVKSFQAGIELLQHAIDLGEPKAMAIVGVMKIVGFFGLSNDIDGGRRLLEQASAAGDAAAARIIGLGYSNGFSGAVDLRRAAKFLRIAADRRDIKATYMLANLLGAGTGVPKDAAESARLMLVAAEAGHADAQLSIGLSSLRGFTGGVTQDPRPALTWLDRAAAQGNPRAKYALGLFYLVIKPELGYSDPARGADLLRQCVETSLDPECSSAYGNAFALGRGVARDPVKAYAFLRLSEDMRPSVKTRERLTGLAALMSPDEIARAQSLAAAVTAKQEKGAHTP